MDRKKIIKSIIDNILYHDNIIIIEDIVHIITEYMYRNILYYDDKQIYVIKPISEYIEVVDGSYAFRELVKRSKFSISYRTPSFITITVNEIDIYSNTTNLLHDRCTTTIVFKSYACNITHSGVIDIF